MSIRYHSIFFFSFCITFTVLFFGSRFLGAQLRAHGYNISDLILLGLPKENTTSLPVSQPTEMSTKGFSFDALRESQTTQVVSLVLAVLSTVYLVWKATAQSE